MEKEAKNKSMSVKLDDDLKEAMKKKDSIKVSTLRMVKAAIQNMTIEKRTESLEDGDILKIISKQIKQREDSIEQFTKGQRSDLAEKETAELEILKMYLPPPLSGDELIAITKEAITEVGAQSKKDMGKVMKIVMEKVKGRADGKAVSQIVSGQLPDVTS